MKSVYMSVVMLSLVLVMFSYKSADAQCVLASYYHEGKRTANGERFNPDGLTAAHRHLKFGTRVHVHYPKTGRSVVVRINDRGPFVKGRTLDISRGAARSLGFTGVGTVCMT